MTWVEVANGLIFHTTWVVGFSLASWATYYNPVGARRAPGPRPPGVRRITKGPYRYMRHPMYIGNWLLVTGLAGVAGGWVNALSIGMLAELVLREWALRDDS